MHERISDSYDVLHPSSALIPYGTLWRRAFSGKAMTSFLHANLPSEDEEDDTFDPEVEEKRKQQGKAAAKPKGPSRCGPSATAVQASHVQDVQRQSAD